MKKIRNYFKPAISIVLLMVMVFCNCTFVSAEAEVDWSTTDQWTDDNSIFVSLTSQTHKVFEPEDFPEVSCKRVVMTYMNTTGENCVYNAVLLVDSVNLDEDISKLSTNEYVTKAERNLYHQQFENKVEISHSNAILKIGQKLEISLTENKLYHEENCFVAVRFVIDPEVIDNENITIDSFKEYGITSFYPLKNILHWSSTDVEKIGMRSESGTYYALEYENQHAPLELVNVLARANGVTYVLLEPAELVIPGPSISYHWHNGRNIEMEKIDEYKVAITGTNPGETYANIDVYTPLKDYEIFCSVTILDEYRDGDVNADALINSSDALVALQNAVNIVELDDVATGRSDVDKDGKVTATDALCILQFSVTEFADGGLIEDYLSK